MIMKDLRLKYKVYLLLYSLFAINGYLNFCLNEIHVVGRQF